MVQQGCQVKWLKIATAMGARASQLAHLLSLLGALSLPDGVLPDSQQRTSGRRAHLLRLAPCLIECIGQPADVYAQGVVVASVTELTAAVRRLLHMVAKELALE